MPFIGSTSLPEVTDRMTIHTRSIREKPEKSDGRRILVVRLCPRGMSKEKVAIDFWARDIAPSNELRKWYSHDPEKWDEFRRRYFAELDDNGEAVAELRSRMGKGTVTLLFGSREARLNNATALVEYLKSRR